MTGWKWSAPLNRLGSLLLLVVLVSAASLKPATADEFEKNIVTGGAKGTYIQIGKDLAAPRPGHDPAKVEDADVR